MRQSTELNDVIMSLDELVNACGQTRPWVLALIEENIISADVPAHTAQVTQANQATYDTNEPLQYFSGYQLTKVRRASRLSRDFDASVPALGLILELINEVEQLRQLKRQWEAHLPVSEVIEVNWE